MFGLSVSTIIELILAGLLAPTLFFCMTLERRLRGLRNDQQSLYMTVRELNAGISQAQASLQGLRAAAKTADETLGAKVTSARLLIDELELLTASGERIASRMETAREPVGRTIRTGHTLTGEALRAVR